QGIAAGEILARLLNGEQASDIPVRRRLPGNNLFDYPQLARFAIPKSRLPEYSTIINEPWYESRKALIWASGLVGLVMLALAWALLVILARKRRADVELRIAAKAFDSQVAMVVSDENGIILRVNQAFAQSTGYSADEAIGKKTAILKSGRHDRAFYEAFWSALQEKHYWQGVIWNRRKNGNVYAEWLTINGVLSPAGKVTHYVGSFSDITQNKEAEAEVHRLAYYDPLTQLPNRRLLQDRLGQALAAAGRSGMCGAILFLDLDNFNTLNDTRGHATGDLLLTQVAQRLGRSLGEADTVARLGGDEFVIVLEDLSDARARFRQPRVPRNRPTVSFEGQRLRVHGEHRHLSLRQFGNGRAPAEERRHGDVPRQGQRSQHLALLRPGNAGDARPAQRARRRPAPGARTR
ncbi:MAG: diguanylate cyclase, partial [Propionivibrio sp.]|nr:diguanylate cyclase [Propionivibrio sp.]